MSDTCVRLSSRALQRLLAGEITVNDFIAAHGWNDGRGPSNPFARMARSGRMISKIEVEGAGDKDDDWLTFSFGPTDPALAPFCVPSAATPVRPQDATREPLPPATDDTV
jgi:hypothetical protein